MKTLVWAVALVLSAALMVAELAMDLTTPDRRRLYLVFCVMALFTFLGAAASLRVAPRLGSLITSMRMVSMAAVVVSGGAVAISALTMFIEPHDLNLVLVALLLGMGLGGVLATAVAGPLTADLASMSTTARQVGEGDLSVRTGIDRKDELGYAARTFDQMIDRLEASEEERRFLLAAIGHDLRTPLTSIQAALEALVDGVAPDPPAYLRGMAHDLDYLRNLVNDLFLMARIDAGRLELLPIPLDLSELADEAVEALTPAAAERQVRLVVQAPGRLGMTGDAAALSRVFRNLLANAVRHSPEGGEVRIELSEVGSQVEAVVIDQGAGFAEAVRPAAFDPFVRADDSRNRDSGGAGLGLAIAKGIVDAHGGSIVIEDRPGGRVRFTLPGS